jgi:prepilin-type N-terminal cleavage/methylation domain-containing protein
MKSILPKFKKGFTLVELLVVMAILGILATITLANFSSSQRKGRDAQRKSDLRQIANALEAYMNDHGEYPISNANGEMVNACGCRDHLRNCVFGALDAANREFCDENNTVYMTDIPDDVNASASWHNYYYVSDRKSYKLYANFENPNDADCLIKSDGLCKPIAAYSGNNYIYGISSSNTTPIDANFLPKGIEGPGEGILNPIEEPGQGIL